MKVKSSGYLQSWRQSRPSRIVFTGLKAFSWDDESGYGAEPEYRADVYVFAVHTCQTPSLYDPLELGYWRFYVLSASVIRNLGQKSLTLSRLAALAGEAVGWSALRDTVRTATAVSSPKPSGSDV